MTEITTEAAKEYGVRVAEGQKAYVVGPGGGVRHKKLTRKFLFSVIRAQQVRINFLFEVIDTLKKEMVKTRDLTLKWEARCNELVQQSHNRASGIEVVDNPKAVDRINQGAKNVK